MSAKWDDEKYTETHVGYHGKSFVIDGPLPLEIDYDDVNHWVVDVIAEDVAKCLNEHFRPSTIMQCRNDDCDLSWGLTERLYPSLGPSVDEILPCPECGERRWFGEASA